ncbi:hypothetical protein H310_10969 [Aphanomyces invadans]|uniref:Uncharacterized protein n=1 Tax=Aphanomyces invadans TaxID=157072 RepID=A0A024TMX5_9STRA|nr:hypothetical protein H310_10969 [Aphanomyces invadans]ETV95500.1 hypothetical protein H310_10969 [Aphanomyces invadans]|eukprot:XP_008875693.1 hypothetical protein H310_10969 [Aphanomyces invadans]
MPNLWKELVIGIGLAIIGVVCLVRIYKQPPTHGLLQVPFNPKNAWLLAFRIAMWSFFLVVWIIQIDSSHWFDLVYYTYWNFSLQTIYFGLAVFDQVRRWTRPTNQANGYLNTLFDVAITSCFLVALVYWILLYSPSKPTEWATWIVHLANVVIFVIEFTVNEHLIQRSSLKFVILWPALFSSLAWIGNVTFNEGFWPYNLMSMDKSIAPVIWFGIGLGHVVCFGIVLLMSAAKRRRVASPPSTAGPTTATLDVQTTDSDVHVEIASPTIKSAADKMHDKMFHQA